MAAEVTVGLDRLAVLNSQQDLNAESKLALRFVVPDEISQREIRYAELVLEIPVAPLREDSLFELSLFSLLAVWEEDNIDFESSEAITDSILIGTYIVHLGESEVFRIDITPYVKELASGARSNFGLIAIADLLGDRNLRVPGNFADAIRQSAAVRIVYK